MLGCHLQPARHVFHYKLLDVTPVGIVDAIVGTAVHGKVVTHTAAHKRPLHPGQRIDSPVNIEQRRMVVVQVGTRRRMQARRANAAAALVAVAPRHHVHVGRWTAKVGYVPLEIVHLRHLFHLTHYRLLAARGYKLALVGRYGAKCTPAEAPAVHVHRVAYHLVGRYAFAVIPRVRQPRIRQVKRRVDFGSCHRLSGTVHLHSHLPGLLPNVTS